MDKQNFIGIIPARYGSTRFPGKPLARLGGMTVIERVYRQATQALDHVIVATDDDRIAQAVTSFGGEAVMTATHHRSGTDRCFEAYLKHGTGEQVVINIQGDEPFVRPSQLATLMACFDDPDTDIATLVRPFAPGGTYEELADPNTAKVIIDNCHRAKYFSRSVIPYVRGAETAQWPQLHQYYIHIGMYAYRADVLAQITQLSPSPLEVAESLEQLRWIENGFTITVGQSQTQTIGIDTPDDLQRAEAYLAQQQQDARHKDGSAAMP